MFKNYQLAIVLFCAEECTRQKSGETSVAWMVKAYDYACERFAVDNTVTVEDVLTLAAMIEPEQNANGFRKVPVTVGGDVIAWENIERQIANLLEAQDRLTPTELYTELEKIHPLLDGNGRLGAILFNVKSGTLYVPVAAPDVFAKSAVA
jgi:hypothetical protein